LRGYLYDNQPKLFIDGHEQSFEFIEESEETEVKNIEELKSWFEDEKLYVGEYVKHKINQLDEPEVLSQEWIDEHKVARVNNLRKMTMDDVVPVEKLQGILVPKQEEIKVSKMWHDVIAQNKEEGHSLRWTLNYIDNLNVNDVDDFAKAWLAYPNIEIEEEPKYYVLDKENATLLKKSAVGEGIAKSVGTNIYNAKSWKNEEEYQLTEQEIKDYDPRYWAFAVKVEELEE